MDRTKIFFEQSVDVISGDSGQDASFVLFLPPVTVPVPVVVVVPVLVASIAAVRFLLALVLL